MTRRLLPHAPPCAVLFDWDMTLADTKRLIEESLGAAMHQFHGNSNGQIASPVELWRLGSVDAFIAKHYAEDKNYTQADRDRLLALFAADYIAHWPEKIAPMEEAETTLRALQARTIPSGIVSNTRQDILEAQVKHLGLAHYFQAIVGADPKLPKKPSPAPLIRAVRTVGCRFDNILYVGDSHVDLQAARSDGFQRICFGNRHAMDHGAVHGADPQGHIIYVKDHAGLCRLIGRSYRPHNAACGPAR